MKIFDPVAMPNDPTPLRKRHFVIFVKTKRSPDVFRDINIEMEHCLKFLHNNEMLAS